MFYIYDIKLKVIDEKTWLGSFDRIRYPHIDQVKEVLFQQYEHIVVVDGPFGMLDVKSLSNLCL